MVCGIDNQFAKSSTGTDGGSPGVSQNQITDKQMAVGCKGMENGEKTGAVPDKKIQVDDEGDGRMKAADENVKIEGEVTEVAQTMEVADEGNEVEADGKGDAKKMGTGQGHVEELEFLRTTLTRLKQGASREDIGENLLSRIASLELSSLAAIKRGGLW